MTGGFIRLLDQRGKTLLPYLVQELHNLGHINPAAMTNCFSNQLWNPASRAKATETAKQCVICQQNNDIPATTTVAAHTPVPPGPFWQLQVDYILMPPYK